MENQVNKLTIDADLVALQNVASKDSTRYNLIGVNVTASHAVATDGFVMAIRKLDQQVNNTPGIYDLSKVKLDKKIPVADFEGNGNGQLVSTMADGKAIKIDGEFPTWKQILPNTTQAVTSISIDAEKLYRLAKALNRPYGDNSKALGVTLEFSGETGAIRVLVNDTKALGILMPMKRGELSSEVD